MMEHGESRIRSQASAWLGALTLAATLQGCTAALNGYPEMSTDVSKELATLDPYHAPDVLTQYNAKPSDDAKKLYRNEVIMARLRANELHFHAFQKALYSQGIGWGVGTDWVLLGLTGAASLAGGAANALAAAATGITGARASFDKQAMYEKTLPVLIAQMVAKRKAVEVRIRVGLTQSNSEYPLLAALSDLQDHYYAGTIPGAISEVAANAGAQKEKAQKELDAILVGLVPADVQLRREKAAAYVKTLSATQHNQLATALGKTPGANALVEILQAISQAETAAKFDVIDQKITILFGPGWRN
jgi:hypothetical protein